MQLAMCQAKAKRQLKKITGWGVWRWSADSRTWRKEGEKGARKGGKLTGSKLVYYNCPLAAIPNGLGFVYVWGLWGWWVVGTHPLQSPFSEPWIGNMLRSQPQCGGKPPGSVLLPFSISGCNFFFSFPNLNFTTRPEIYTTTSESVSSRRCVACVWCFRTPPLKLFHQNVQPQDKRLPLLCKNTCTLFWELPYGR